MKADAIGLHADCTFGILQKQQRETQQSGIMSPFLEQTPGSKLAFSPLPTFLPNAVPIFPGKLQ